MSGTLNRAQLRLLRRLIKADASIDCRASLGPYPVRPRGDRRAKPLGWVEDDMLKSLHAFGALRESPRGLKVARKLAMRLSDPNAERGLSEQHGVHTERDIYTPAGVVRRARVNQSFDALRRASHRAKNSPPHTASSAVLAPHLIEAGERFARDYARAHGDHIATQNYAAPMVDGGMSPSDVSATRAAAQIDGHARYQAARAAIGSGLDRTVIALCCNDYALDRLERDEGWVRGAGLIVLRMGLERLAEFYGTQARAHGSSGLAVNPGVARA